MWVTVFTPWYWIHHPIMVTRVCRRCNAMSTLIMFQIHPRSHTSQLSTCLVYISCVGGMFYSWYRRCIHSCAIIFLCESPVQVWLGLDNRKPAWRGDTTPQDVVEAIIMLSGRDVQELVLWRRGRKHLSNGGASRHVHMSRHWDLRYERVEILNACVRFSEVCRCGTDANAS